MIVACIGKREVRCSEAFFLQHVGARLAEEASIIRSGNAPGSDQYYAYGASAIDPRLVELYLPWPSFEARYIRPGNVVIHASQASSEHEKLAEASHPHWHSLRQGVRQLMIRNAMIIRGLVQPVDMVYALPSYRKDGWSGTGAGIRVAGMLGIPVLLLDRNQIWNPVDGTRKEPVT